MLLYWCFLFTVLFTLYYCNRVTPHSDVQSRYKRIVSKASHKKISIHPPSLTDGIRSIHSMYKLTRNISYYFFQSRQVSFLASHPRYPPYHKRFNVSLHLIYIQRSWRHMPAFTWRSNTVSHWRSNLLWCPLRRHFWWISVHARCII